MATRHTVQQGECLSSIAEKYGFFIETLWNHPENAGLRELRDSPFVLHAGDGIFIPDLRQNDIECGTDRRHVFRRRGVPEHLRLTYFDDGNPRAGLPYRLVIDDNERTGRTNQQGQLDEWIPNQARRGFILLPKPGTPKHRWDDESTWVRMKLALGELDPADTERGARMRLCHLRRIASTDVSANRYKLALCAFQSENGLEVTGELDPATAAKLVERHGS